MTRARVLLTAGLLLAFTAMAHAQGTGAGPTQGLTLPLPGGGPGATARLVQITALITVLSLAPSLLVMVTAFTRIVIVL
ncbi:MAG: flagellar type III secretion system pore protein FliP, partial [Acetobacteraceae bacterium]